MTRREAQVPEPAFDAPRRIAQLMAGFDRPWAFCGGWAIDIFLGRQTRPHKDVDIAVSRRDQLAIRSYLSARGWTLEKAQDGKLVPWADGETLELPIHVIWCKNAAHEPDFLEVLFNEVDDAHFRFRRDPSLTLPLDRAFVSSELGLPIIAPKIALLYKAKYPSHEGSDADFRAALPHLDAASRDWLRQAVARLHPDHPWVVALG